MMAIKNIRPLLTMAGAVLLSLIFLKGEPNPKGKDSPSSLLSLQGHLSKMAVPLSAQQKLSPQKISHLAEDEFLPHSAGRSLHEVVAMASLTQKELELKAAFPPNATGALLFDLIFLGYHHRDFPDSQGAQMDMIYFLKERPLQTFQDLGKVLSEEVLEKPEWTEARASLYVLLGQLKGKKGSDPKNFDEEVNTFLLDEFFNGETKKMEEIQKNFKDNPQAALPLIVLHQVLMDRLSLTEAQTVTERILEEIDILSLKERLQGQFLKNFQR